MSVIDSLLNLVAPHECIGCGLEGSLVCRYCCHTKLLPAPQRCYRCWQTVTDGATCASCAAEAGLESVFAAVQYHTAAQSLVWRLKYHGAQAATAVMVQCLLDYGWSAAASTILVPVPTASSRVRQRGFDQAVLLAHELSRRTGLPLGNYLRRQGQAHQVGASRRQRKAQLQNAFYAKFPKAMRDKHLLLVDDVLTTGATLEAAAQSLRQAGAARVSAVVFAQALGHKS